MNAGGSLAMRKILWFLVASLALATTAWAGDLPSEFTYIFYVEGKEAGKSTTKVSEMADTYILETHTVVKTGAFDLDLSTRTEVDKQSFLPLNFTYVGEKRGVDISGETTVDGNEATCLVSSGDNSFTSERSSEHPILLLEDYDMAHEAVIARAFWEAGAKPAVYSVVFPSTGVITGCEIQKESELSLESETKETYCVKFVVGLQNSTPFASFFDPKRGLPVYLVFPGTATEAFLDEFYDGRPITRYRSR
jgi:hypothetical protein